MKFLSHYDFKLENPAPDAQDQFQHIQACREQRRVEACSACPYFDVCELLKSYLRVKAGYGDSSEGGTSGGT